MTSEILRAKDHRRMPWKNGKGVTIEICVAPAGASTDDFDWRLSTATVDSDGPFSVFPGIERSLSVLDGEGIFLNVEGTDEARLTIESAPFSFAADSPTTARLIGGTITDLNAMSRIGRARHNLSAHEIAGDASLSAKGETCLIFCGAGEVSIDGVTLAELDCLRLDGEAGRSIKVSGKGRLYLIAFDPA